jgi:hypothetical protein
MQKTVKIFRSHEDQEFDDVQYWRALPGVNKLEVLEAIRAQVWMMRDEHPGRFQRVYRLAKRASG